MFGYCNFFCSVFWDNKNYTIEMRLGGGGLVKRIFFGGIP